jgi:hypothetical protein
MILFNKKKLTIIIQKEPFSDQTKYREGKRSETKIKNLKAT